jgi:hypothetical protein
VRDTIGYNGPASRRDVLKAICAAGGMVLLSSTAWGCISGTSGNRVEGSNVTYTITDKVSTRFSEYSPLPVNIIPSVPDYSVSPGLTGVLGVERAGLNEAQKKRLAENLFLLSESKYDQVYDIYKWCKNAGAPAFVTTDSVLHAYHILYDYILRVLEMERFSPDIIEMTDGLLKESVSQLNSGVKELDEAALKNVAFFAVASTLLGLDRSIPAEAMTLVRKELSLIEAHSGFDESPIFGYLEDYSQYVPRGHYTRNDTLKKYFMAMMWYGRMSFRIKTKNIGLNKEQTRRAIMITLSMKPRIYELWKKVYEPTVFMVGESDDLSIFEYNALIKEVYGDNVKLSDLADDNKIMDLIEKAAKLKAPKIISTYIEDRENKEALKGFRLMGQRFIPDSYMFQELVYDKVGTQGNPRLFPLGLDIMAVLGSERAYEILDRVYGETKYANYDKQMSSLKSQFSALKEDTWAQNLYWNWLYCLMALLNEKGDGYPSFMKNMAWVDKELNTSLGSWAELRHDTILYAKQSYTVRATSILPQEEHARGYVEPNPELYGRLASLAAMTENGLSSRGILSDMFSGKLKSLKELLLSLKWISEKELTVKPLSEGEYGLIKDFGDKLESITTFPPEINESMSNDADKKMAVIADVHTDTNTETVLEEGVGKPYHIYVIIMDNGKPVLTTGGAFSYYEFKHPMSDRLTDEKWQEMLVSGKAPEPPEWTGSFLL